MKYQKVKVHNLWIWIEHPNWPRTETGCKFNRPTRNRTYVKILSKCLTYADAKILFPHTNHPMMEQVRDMCRAGLLHRYVYEGDKRLKYYYKTTNKGKALLSQVVKD